MEDIVLIGFGGHGKSVADSIERQGIYRIAGYTDPIEHDSPYLYLGTDDALEILYARGIRHAAVCVGYMGQGSLRERLYERAKRIGFSLPVIVDPTAVVAESATLGEGSFVGKMAVLNAEARIGKMAIINTKAVVEHECTVGDFSHVSVAAVLCGTVKIGNACFVGANATVIQALTLGNRTVVGAGAVVTKSLDDQIVFRHKYENVLKRC